MKNKKESFTNLILFLHLLCLPADLLIPEVYNLTGYSINLLVSIISAVLLGIIHPNLNKYKILGLLAIIYITTLYLISDSIDPTMKKTAGLGWFAAIGLFCAYSGVKIDSKKEIIIQNALIGCSVIILLAALRWDIKINQRLGFPVAGGNPNLLCITLGIAFISNLHKYLIVKKKWILIIGLITFGLILWTHSRAGIISTTIVSILFSFHYFSDSKKLLYVIPILMILTIPVFLEGINSRFEIPLILRNSRIEIWAASCHLIWDNFETGVGLGQMPYYLKWVYSDMLTEGTNLVLSNRIDPHNTILSILGEFGIIFGIAILGIITFTIKKCRPAKHLHMDFIYNSIVFIIFVGMFNNVIFSKILWILIGVKIKARH